MVHLYALIAIYIFLENLPHFLLPSVLWSDAHLVMSWTSI